MTLSSIRLQNFRSYTDDSFEFSDGVNIIVGPNASGKTNLLEALMVSCLGGSYRARDIDLLRFGAPWARLDAQAGNHQRSVKLVMKPQQTGITKTLIIDDQEYKRFTLPKKVPVVVFEPHHLSLLSGPPELRRQFIDDLLEQTIPGFALIRNHYKRTLTQRNALLKSGHHSQPQLFAWNIRLSELGGQIFAERYRLLEKFNERIKQVYGGIAHADEAVELIYSGTCSLEQYGSAMLRKLEANTDLDYRRGFTSCGPHRDDIVVQLNGHRAQETASRGEIRSLLLTLKILELQLLEAARERAPILLLDDVFSELDGARRRALTGFLQPYQTFITTTDADVVVQHFMEDCHIIPMG
jgi:DNA replication and repair protein RecF